MHIRETQCKALTKIVGLVRVGWVVPNYMPLPVYVAISYARVLYEVCMYNALTCQGDACLSRMHIPGIHVRS